GHVHQDTATTPAAASSSAGSPNLTPATPRTSCAPSTARVITIGRSGGTGLFAARGQPDRNPAATAASVARTRHSSDAKHAVMKTIIGAFRENECPQGAQILPTLRHSLPDLISVRRRDTGPRPRRAGGVDHYGSCPGEPDRRAFS